MSAARAAAGRALAAVAAVVRQIRDDALVALGAEPAEPLAEAARCGLLADGERCTKPAAHDTLQHDFPGGLALLDLGGHAISYSVPAPGGAVRHRARASSRPR